MELLDTTDRAAPAEDDVPSPMNSPVTEPKSAAETISPPFRGDSDRRTLGTFAGPSMVAETTRADAGAGGTDDAQAASSEPAAPFGADVPPDSGPAGTVSRRLAGS